MEKLFFPPKTKQSCKNGGQTENRKIIDRSNENKNQKAQETEPKPLFRRQKANSRVNHADSNPSPM
jgi:hypothetical protein